MLNFISLNKIPNSHSFVETKQEKKGQVSFKSLFTILKNQSQPIRNKQPQSIERNQDHYQMNSIRNNIQITPKSRLKGPQNPQKQFKNTFFRAQDSQSPDNDGSRQTEKNPKQQYLFSKISTTVRNTSKKQEHLNHRNLIYYQNENSFENHKDKIKKALLNKTTNSQSPPQSQLIQMRLSSIESIKKNLLSRSFKQRIHLNSSLQDKNNQSSLNQPQISHFQDNFTQSSPQNASKNTKTADFTDNYNDLKNEDQNRLNSQSKKYQTKQECQIESQRYLKTVQVLDKNKSIDDPLSLQTESFLQISNQKKTLLIELPKESNQAYYNDSIQNNNNSINSRTSTQNNDLIKKDKNKTFSDESSPSINRKLIFQQQEQSFQKQQFDSDQNQQQLILKQKEKTKKVSEAKLIMDQQLMTPKNLKIVSPKQVPYNYDEELDGLEVYQLDNKKISNQKKILPMTNQTQITSKYIYQFVVEYTKAFDYLNLVGTTVAQCLDYLNAKQNYWIIPLFLIFKRMFQLRVEAEIQMNAKKNTLKFDFWAEIILSKEYEDLMEKVVHENDMVEKELQQLKKVAIKKVSKLDQTRRTKVEWFLNDDPNQDIRDTTFVYLYSQVLINVRSNSTDNPKFSKLEWMNLIISIQKSIIICELPVLEYPSNLLIYDEQLLDQCKNEEANLQKQLDYFGKIVEKQKVRLVKLGFKF